MRSLRYLNTVLTVIAVLLTLNLWTLWMGGPSFDTPTRAEAAGIPDAGAQRKEIIDLLKSLNQKTDAMAGMFKTGDAKVTVQNPDTGEKK